MDKKPDVESVTKVVDDVELELLTASEINFEEPTEADLRKYMRNTGAPRTERREEAKQIWREKHPG